MRLVSSNWECFAHYKHISYFSVCIHTGTPRVPSAGPISKFCMHVKSVRIRLPLRDGCYLCTSLCVLPKKVHSGSFCGTFWGIWPKKKGVRRKCSVLELVPLRSEKHFKPRPQNGILVPLRGSLKISTPIIFIWESLSLSLPLYVFQTARNFLYYFVPYRGCMWSKL